MPEQESIERLLEEHERALLEPNLRKSAFVGQLLAESFVEFGSSGRVFNKAQVIAALHAESPTQVVASEFRIRLLTPEVALVTYRAVRSGQPPRGTLRSSVWRRQEGQWQMVFHQGTFAEEVP